MISSSSVSVNAEFQQVPPGFEGEAITATVMGDVELQVCGHFGTAKLFMSVSDGRKNLTFHPGPTTAALASLSMEKAMAMSGVKMVEERYICNLRRMTCEWMYANELPATLAAPQVDMRHSRVKVRHSDIQVDVSRNAMVNLGGKNGVPLSTVDCTDFSEYALAEKACKALLYGFAPPKKRQEWLLMLILTTLPREQQFFFTQIDIPFVRHVQRDVHGLLGQRAVQPFTRPVDPAAKAAKASRDALFADRSPTGSIFGQAGPRRAVRDDDPASSTAELFGAHGEERAIEGRYSDYMVESISEHDRFKYSRFACAGGAGRSPIVL